MRSALIGCVRSSGSKLLRGDICRVYRRCGLCGMPHEDERTTLAVSVCRSHNAQVEKAKSQKTKRSKENFTPFLKATSNTSFHIKLYVHSSKNSAPARENRRRSRAARARLADAVARARALVA